MARMAYLEKATAANGQNACTCWDCLRDTGATPPRFMRDKHKRLYPETAFREDLAGVPQPDRKQYKKQTTTQEEQSHLRAAVRNREAI